MMATLMSKLMPVPVLVLVSLLVAGCSLPLPTVVPVSPTARTPPPSADAAAPSYEREAFGEGWAAVGRGCDTRDLVLARDLDPDQRRGCDVVGGTLRDPYTGRVVVGAARALDIDHVVPLAYAWERGAWRWSPARRERFANDLGNLRTTTAKVNRSKGDQGLDEWLPGVDRCGYAQAFDAVADRFGLTDEQRDSQITAACR